MRDGNWVVCTHEKENTFTVFYNGSDKAKARNAATVALTRSKEVFAFRVTRSARLSADSLKTVLPREAF